MPVILGPRKKPKHCISNCPRQVYGTGFVPDTFTKTTKIGILKYQPSTDEVNTRGTTDEFIPFLTAAKINPEELGVSYMLRCKAYENGTDKVTQLRKAQKICRYFDTKTNVAGKALEIEGGGLQEFNPDIFIITFDVKQLEKADAFKVFFRRAFVMAKEFSDHGYKPLICCGLEVAMLLQPELFSSQEIDRDTTFRSWVGHWWLGSWPFAQWDKPDEKPSQKLVNIENSAKNKLRRL